MKSLTVADFTAPIEDVEQRQYHILGLLKARREEFGHTRLFPSLSELLELKRNLEILLNRREQVDANLPRTIRDVDWEKKELVYEAEHSNPADVDRLFELCSWALPHISSVLEEGKVVYDFVDEHVQLEGVGIMPIRHAEGYFFVPDHRTHILHILRYELSMLRAHDDQYQAMKTHELHQLLESNVAIAPESIKMSLLREHQDLPNPATFMCETDLDFPYQETILPVAKRKLMSHLVS